MGDLVLSAVAGKVRFIIGDGGVENPEVIPYIMPEELNTLLPSDFKEQHCLDSFGEVVGDYQQEP